MLDSGRESAAGRYHHPDAFSMWLAGGGIKHGVTIGRTDDLCMKVVEDRAHGLHHDKLTYPYQDRNFRLTDVGGRIVRKMLARTKPIMTIADLNEIQGRVFPARRRTQNLVGGASPIQCANFAAGNVTLEPHAGQVPWHNQEQEEV